MHGNKPVKVLLTLCSIENIAHRCSLKANIALRFTSFYTSLCTGCSQKEE